MYILYVVTYVAYVDTRVFIFLDTIDNHNNNDDDDDYNHIAHITIIATTTIITIVMLSSLLLPPTESKMLNGHQNLVNTTVYKYVYVHYVVIRIHTYIHTCY